MIRDTFDFIDDNRRERDRFGDNESLRGNDDARSSLIDLNLYLHHETPAKGEYNKGAILVSKDGDAKHAQWIPKSRCEFERLDSFSYGRDQHAHQCTVQAVTVTMKKGFAKEKGLV